MILKRVIGLVFAGALAFSAMAGEIVIRLAPPRMVIEKRGTPKAVLLSIRDYVKLAAPEPEVLRLLGEESKRKGTHAITSRQIDKIVQASRAQKKKPLPR